MKLKHCLKPTLTVIELNNSLFKHTDDLLFTYIKKKNLRKKIKRCKRRKTNKASVTFGLFTPMSFPQGVLCCVWIVLLKGRGDGSKRLVQLIQLMKDLCSCLPLSACTFPECLISPPYV